MNPSRTPYPTDVSDEEWTFVAPYLLLLPEDAGQRTYSLHEVFNGLRWIARAGAPWCMMPNDLPPWYIVYQQTQRWLAAGCFVAIVDDLRCYCEKPRDATGSLRQPYWIAAPCSQRPRAGVVLAVMERSDARAARCMRQSIPRA